jgi:hypothetical protein
MAHEFDDVDDLDDIGALEDIGISPMAMMQRYVRGRGRRVARPRRVAIRTPQVRTALRRPPIIQAVPGLSQEALKYIPFGLGFVSFPVAATTATLTQQPQIPLKVRKLTVAVSRSGAAAAALVLISAFNIGTINQFAGAGNVDTAMFIANAEGATMDLSPAGPGINITLNLLSTVAPAVLGELIVSATFLAQAVNA